MTRIFNIFLSLVLMLFLLLPIAVIFILVKLTSSGPAIHWSKRVGKKNKIFLMPKFRTMFVKTPQLATHLMTESKSYLTPIGRVLRKLSLDELPQLWSVLVGEMSFVGPRPALFNQDDLVELRTKSGVDAVAPGITGWAQVNGRDELSIPKKVELDSFYVQNQSLLFDCKILLLTVKQSIKGSGISH